MRGLSGKSALVLGGVGGVGLAIARRLSDEGAFVTVTGRRAADVEAALVELGDETKGLQGDAGDSDDVQRLVVEAVKLMQGIDLLVLTAAVYEASTLEETTPQFLQRLFGVNVGGTVFAVQAAAEVMEHGGSIVVLGSVADVEGTKSYSTYAATKAALRSYVRSWALELAERRVRVNVVSPGPTDTAMFRSNTRERQERLISEVPLRRIARADEIASCVAFLLSDDASFVTGAELCVDGGMKQV